jgi:hypothetical protein
VDLAFECLADKAIMRFFGRTMPAAPLTPAEIFDRFERGQIERDEMHALMALHARELIEEMVEDHANPLAAWLEQWSARKEVRRLSRRHGTRLLREVLMALATVGDFPPARYLWNASHPDVPLHCFLRIRREPVFRIREIRLEAGGGLRVCCQYGLPGGKETIHRAIRLKRDASWSLRPVAD